MLGRAAAPQMEALARMMQKKRVFTGEVRGFDFRLMIVDFGFLK
jgi:hypothetical protein